MAINITKRLETLEFNLQPQDGMESRERFYRSLSTPELEALAKALRTDAPGCQRAANAYAAEHPNLSSQDQVRGFIVDVLMKGAVAA